MSSAVTLATDCTDATDALLAEATDATDALDSDNIEDTIALDSDAGMFAFVMAALAAAIWRVSCILHIM